MKKPLLRLMALIVCFAFPLASNANENEDSVDVQYVYIEQTDGSITKYALEDDPVFTFEGDTMVVTCQGDELLFGLSDVKYYYFETVKVATAIRSVTVNGNGGNEDVRPTIAFGEASFSGLKAGARVAVYTIGGQAVSIVKADADGNAAIDLSQLPKGIYILRTPSKSFKIYNK